MRNPTVPDELARLLPELGEITGCRDWTMTRGHLTRRDCAIYFLDSQEFRVPELVIKVLRNANGKNKARDIHRKSLPFFKAATAAFTIPEPLFPLGGGDALAMECIDAPLCRAGGQRNPARQSVRRRRRKIIAYHDPGKIALLPVTQDHDGTWDRTHTMRRD